MGAPGGGRLARPPADLKTIRATGILTRRSPDLAEFVECSWSPLKTEGQAVSKISRVHAEIGGGIVSSGPATVEFQALGCRS